jgi:hypothetical protein
VVVVGIVGSGSCNVATAGGYSGCEGRGWEVSHSTVSQLGSVCHCLQDVGGCFDGGGGVVMAIVNGIGSYNVAVTACAGIVGHDMAGDADGRGIKTVQQGVVWDRLRGSVDVPASLSGHGSLSVDAVCITASTVKVEVVWVAALVVS